MSGIIHGGAWFSTCAPKLWDNGYRSLLPVKSDGRPAIARWQHWASGMPEDAVEAFVTRFGDHGVGGITGRLIVFDIDADNRIDADRARSILREIAGCTPLEVHGSNDVRGKLLYRTRHMFNGRKAKPYEVLARGNYAALFGLHRKTGKPYRWRDESPLDVLFDQLPEVTEAQAAQWLESLQPKTARAATGPVREGERNDRLFREAMRLAGAGLSPEELERRLGVFNETFDPPLPDDEVRNVATSVLGYRAKGTLRVAGDDPYIQLGLSAWNRLRNDHAALRLLVDLMFAHGADPQKVFAISAKAMAAAPDMPAKNTILKGRVSLVEHGILDQVQNGGRRPRPDGSGFDNQPNLYRWAPGALERIRGRAGGSTFDHDITQQPPQQVEVPIRRAPDAAPIPWHVLDDLVTWNRGLMPESVSVAMYRRLHADGITITDLASVLGLSRQQLGNVLVRRFGTRPEMATKLKAWFAGALPEGAALRRRRPVQLAFDLHDPAITRMAPDRRVTA